MGKIIALRGRAVSGKTTTIHLLPAILIAHGHRHVSGAIPPDVDFSAIFENGKFKVGVTSIGDTYEDIHDALTHFVNAGCEVCICACRTWGRTVAAVNCFSTHPVQYVPKTIVSAPAHEAAANAADANTIFGLI
jgi:hypothetical protein